MKKKIAYFIVWILILEVLLHLSAFVVQGWNKYARDTGESSHGQYKVLCLGESTTGLGGASAYPAILERKLNTKVGNDFFQVINAGMPGKDSNDIVESIDQLIADNRPELGILMVGINDYWNLPDREIKYWERGLEVLSPYSRIAKIIRLSLINNEESISVPFTDPLMSTCNQGPLYSAKEYSSQKVLENLIEKKVTSYDIYLNLAEIYKNKNQIDKAIETLKLGISRLNPYGYCGDSYLLQERLISYYEKDLKESKKALDLIEEFLNQRMITHYRFKLVDERKRIRSALGLPPSPAKVLTYWENQTYKKNIQLLVKKFQEKRIPVIVMQYPLLPITPLKQIIINHEGVTFMENVDGFEEILKKHKYSDVFSDSFAHVFGHMTPFGAQVMAQNLTPVVLNLSNKD